MEKIPINGPIKKSRRWFLQSVAATGAVLASREAMAQEHPINVMKRVHALMNRRGDARVFSTLLVSSTVVAPPELKADIVRAEIRQQELFNDIVQRLKQILSAIALNDEGGPGNPPRAIMRRIEQDAEDIHLRAANFIEDESKLNELLKDPRVRQTQESLRVLDERRGVMRDIVTPIIQVLPDMEAARSLFNKPYR